MRFLKDNSEIIVKLYINQIGIAIFSLFLYTAIGAFGQENDEMSFVFKLLVSAFSVLFYFVLIYTAVWEIGAKDKIRIDGGRLERKPLKGLFVGLFANVINFVITGVALLLSGLYLLGCGEVFKTVFAVLNLIFRLFMGMYLGLAQGISYMFTVADDVKFFIETAAFLVLPLLSVLVVHFAYQMGLNEKRIFPARKQN